MSPVASPMVTPVGAVGYIEYTYPVVGQFTEFDVKYELNVVMVPF